MFYILLIWFILFVLITCLYHLFFGLIKSFFNYGTNDKESYNKLFLVLLKINYIIYFILIAFCLVYVGSAVLFRYGYNFKGYALAIFIGIIIILIDNLSFKYRFDKLKYYFYNNNYNSKYIEIYSAPFDIILFTFSLVFPSLFIEFGILLNNLF